MKKKILSIAVVIALLISTPFYNPSVSAIELPSVSRESVTVKQGDDIDISVDYGDTSRGAEIVVSNLNIDAYLSGGTLNIEGLKEGRAYVQIYFSDGTVKEVAVEVSNKYGSTISDSDLEIEVNEYTYISIDLEDYDADSATLYYDNDIISVSKEKLIESGRVRIKGLDNGETTLKIKYDTGDYEYITVNVLNDTLDEEDSTVSENDITLEENDSYIIYINLGEDATEAVLDYNSRYISTDMDILTRSREIEITAERIGSTVLTVEFDDGTVEEIDIEIKDEDYESPSVSLDEIKLNIGESIDIELDYGSDSTYATITVSKPKSVDLGVNGYSPTKTSYKVFPNKNNTYLLSVEGKVVDSNADVTVKFSEGKSFKIDISVDKLNLNRAGGIDKNKVNYYLKSGMSTNEYRVKMGYITGYPNNIFKPEGKITKEEFGVMLSRLLNINTVVKEEDYLIDVTSEWSKGELAKLVSAGVIQNNNYYLPSVAITRCEVVDMLYNTIDLEKYSTICILTDVDTTTTVGKKIAKAYNAGLLAGYPNGTFGANNEITRAEIVVLLNRVFFNGSEVEKENKFTDINEAFWAYKDIIKASN